MELGLGGRGRPPLQTRNAIVLIGLFCRSFFGQIKLNQILNTLGIFARCPFFEGGARKFFTFSAMGKAFFCRAIVKVASAVPWGFADGSDLATSGTSFIEKKLASVAVYSADGQIFHLMYTLLPSTSILPSQKRRTASGRIFHSASCMMRSWRVSGVSSCLTSTAFWSTMGPASHSGMTM